MAAVLAAIAPPVSAQQADDAVVVTATRFPESALEAPVGMTVITARQIANSPATSLPQLLSQQAGIVTRDTSGGPDAQVDMRGFGMTGDQNTLVLLNGQRLNEIELVTTRWSAIPLDSVERIEILRGSGAVLYGAGATGGTINIITKGPRPGTRTASIGASGGSYETRDLRASVSMAGENAGLSLHANDYVSNNYRRNNRVDQQNIDGDLRWFLPRGNVAFKFGLDNQNLQLPGARTQAQLQTDPRGTSTPRDFGTRDGARASLGGAVETRLGELAGEFAYRDSNRTALLRDYVFGAFDTFTDTNVKMWSLTPRLKAPFEAFGRRHSLVVGIDAEDWDYVSRRASRMESLATPAAHIIAAQSHRAFYAQNHSALSDDTKLTLGARWQRVTMSARDQRNPAAYANGTKTSSPRAWEVGLRHNLTENTAIFGRVGQSFRVGTVDEIYSQFAPPFFDARVTLLEPQTSRDHEVGAEYRQGPLRVRASAFAMYLKNEIHFFFPAGANINLPPTERQGLELDGSFAASRTVTLFANANYTDARFRDGSLGGVDMRGKRVPLVPRDTFNAGVSWEMAARSVLSGVVRYVGKQHYDNDQANSFPSQMPAYTVADMKYTYALGRFKLGAAINNLFNERYYSYAIRNGAGTSFNAYPQRERNYLLTLEYRL
jgi:iron complex outermembrane receptor protein